VSPHSNLYRRHFITRRGAVRTGPTELLFWCDQLASKPVHCRFGLHGITELHCRLKLIRATMAFKGPKVVTRRPWRDTSQRHFGLAVRAYYLLQLGQGAPLLNQAGAQHSLSSLDTCDGTMMARPEHKSYTRACSKSLIGKQSRGVWLTKLRKNHSNMKD
jgi:hypothetical protein